MAGTYSRKHITNLCRRLNTRSCSIFYVIIAYAAFFKLLLSLSSSMIESSISTKNVINNTNKQRDNVISNHYSDHTIDKLMEYRAESRSEILLERAFSNYTFLIKEASKCDDFVRIRRQKHLKGPLGVRNGTLYNDEVGPELLAVAMVGSALRNFRERQNVRSSWGHPAIIQRSGIPVVFVVGVTSNIQGQMSLVRESLKYRDIIQADFLDTYNNLSLKTLAGLSWAQEYCPRAHWVLKTDDDMAVNVFSMQEYLRQLWSDARKDAKGSTKAITVSNVVDRNSCLEALESCVLCDKLSIGASAKVPNAGKFVVSESEWKESTFPPYCHGVGYLFPTRSVKRVMMAAAREPFLRAEDVFITGILAKSSGFTLHKMHSYPSLLHALQAREKVNVFLNGTRLTLELDRDLEYGSITGPELWSELLAANNISIES